ncbi:MAG: NUDIX hydrolase, partial [Actinomycetota bacterium]|nr:NUDIX hydrolase [Actinomycetota bacterium]
GQEVTDAAWMNPLRALERGEEGEIELVFPTIKQLESLVPYATADEAMKAARALRVEPIMPNVVPDASDAGWRMLMPGDDGYRPPVV